MNLLTASISISSLTLVISIIKFAFPNVFVERAKKKAMLHWDEALTEIEINTIKSYTRMSGLINLLFSAIFIIFGVHILLYGVAWFGADLDEYITVFAGIAILTFVCGIYYIAILPAIRVRCGILREAGMIRRLGLDHFLITVSCVMLLMELMR